MNLFRKESLKQHLSLIAISALLVLAACGEAQKPMNSRQTVLKSNKIELTVPATQNVIINEQELEILEQGLPSDLKAEINVWEKKPSGETADGASVQMTFVKDTDNTVTAQIDVVEDPNNLEQTPVHVEAAVLTAAAELRSQKEDMFADGPTHKVTANLNIIKRLQANVKRLSENGISFFSAQPAD